MDKDWLRAKALARGRGAQVELSEALNLSQTVVNKMISGVRKKISSEEADIIREVVARWDSEANAGAEVAGARPAEVSQPRGTDIVGMPATLPGLDARPAAAARPPQDAPETVMTPVPHQPGRPDVPVWASAAAGSDGAMVLVNEPIDWIRRSERMQGVAKPFAFYVIGDSMSPAIDHGDQVVINPAVLPEIGKDHVFLQTQEDGTILALVKRLLRTGASSWRVRQFNPERDFDLPKSKWSRALRISEKRV